MLTFIKVILMFVSFSFVVTVYSKIPFNKQNHEKSFKTFDSIEPQKYGEYNPHPPSKLNMPKEAAKVIKDLRKSHNDIHHLVR